MGGDGGLDSAQEDRTWAMLNKEVSLKRCRMTASSLIVSLPNLSKCQINQYVSVWEITWLDVDLLAQDFNTIEEKSEALQCSALAKAWEAFV
jgi:hypothetical protein